VREQYRDRMLGGTTAGAAPATTANPAISRRYKMMDKETYRNTVVPTLSDTQSASPADQPAATQ
jgi:hypothetical protein